MKKQVVDFSTLPKDKLAEAMGNLLADMVAPIVEQVIRHRLKLVSTEIIKNLSAEHDKCLMCGSYHGNGLPCPSLAPTANE